MKLSSFLKSFNGQYGAIIGLDCKHQAGQYRLAVEIHRAGATLPFPTALFGTGQIELIPEDINQPVTRVHRQFMPGAVNLYLYVDFVHDPHLRILVSRDLRTNTLTIFLR